MKGCRNRVELNLCVPKRSPVAIRIRTQSYIPPFPHSDLFDDYLSGPTIEDMLEYPAYKDDFPINPFSRPFMQSSWKYFKDYGYRIQNDFAVAFNRQEPIMVPEHLIPAVNPPAGPPQCLEDAINGVTLVGRSGSSQQIQVNDVEILGMKEMLDRVAVLGVTDRIRAFMCGKTPEEDYICLRPEEDSVKLSRDEILINLDIDSVIWITHHIHVRSSLKVHVLPYMKKQPPISKDNHCRVEILFPQSEQDRSEGSRTEWLTKPVPLSQLPHLPFAQLGDGSGSFNFYVVFPRMRHRNHFNGRWANLIPSEVQNFWINEVVIPAIQETAPVGVREYAVFTLKEWMWKAKINGRLQSSKTVTLDPDSISRLVHKMREIIQSKPVELSPYGSFFFVMDARGIKLSTVNVPGRDPDPYATLQKEFTGLDWEYMMLRENGQLLMDLGISYHPIPKNGQALVGIWKLNSTLASYQTAGMNSPQIFRSCTMAGYGGLQATMGAIRSRSVQFTLRSSYSLLFESVRRPGQAEKFCPDSEAFNMTAAFRSTCKEFIEIYSNAENKSYGLREEIRGSGLAIREAILVAIDKVRSLV